MTVRSGDVHALIGPNGSGEDDRRSTFISALYRSDGGSIRFDGVELLGRPAHAIAKLGVARTFQNIRLFGDLSVLENVMIGRHVRTRVGFVGRRIPAVRRDARNARRANVRASCCRFVGLGDVAAASARSLPYGDQRRVEIARALASEPRCCCSTNPPRGLNPAETDALVALLRRIATTAPPCCRSSTTLESGDVDQTASPC